MRPIIALNFKNYPEAVGAKAVTLVRGFQTIKSNKYDLVVAPSVLDLRSVLDSKSRSKKVAIYSQHADPNDFGAYTGSIPVAELAKLGASGTILNHSEYKVPLQTLEKTIIECRKRKLITIVCASSLSEVKKVVKMQPDYIAYEPKELIGGNKSVTTAKPDVIVKCVEIVKRNNRKTKVLVGAGVHNKEDIGQALLLGAVGVLIGHAVPKAKNPVAFLEGLMV